MSEIEDLTFSDGILRCKFKGILRRGSVVEIGQPRAGDGCRYVAIWYSSGHMVRVPWWADPATADPKEISAELHEAITHALAMRPAPATLESWLEASRGSDKAGLEVDRAGGALEGETLYEACARLLSEHRTAKAGAPFYEAAERWIGSIHALAAQCQDPEGKSRLEGQATGAEIGLAELRSLDVVRKAETFDSWLASRGLPSDWTGPLDAWAWVDMPSGDPVTWHVRVSDREILSLTGRPWYRWDDLTSEQQGQAVKYREGER